MSVITNLPVVPSRIAILYHFLQMYDKGLSRDELRAYLAPRALQSRGGDEGPATTIADAVLREAKTLGLVEDGEEDGLRVPQERRGMNDFAFRDYLETKLLLPAEAEQYGQPLFPYVLAWFLAQDPAAPLVFSDNLRQQVETECGPRSGPQISSELSNHSKFENFVYWARYLGYCWRLQTANQSMVIPDPTAALERCLLSILKQRIEVTVEGLMEVLGECSPVLDGGEVREELEGVLPSEKRRAEGTLSRTTSLGLLQLERKGGIALERRHDAPAVRLTSWPDERSVSHIILRVRS
ncbi:hypothetical protein NKDENANG_00359 [Candidatus Entotheonellaceae bacterium PAL068K]